MKTNRPLILTLLTLFVLTNAGLDFFWLGNIASFDGNWLPILCMTARCLVISLTLTGILSARKFHRTFES